MNDAISSQLYDYFWKLKTLFEKEYPDCLHVNLRIGDSDGSYFEVSAEWLPNEKELKDKFG